MWLLGTPASPLPPSGVRRLLCGPGLPFDHGRTREAEEWRWTEAASNGTTTTKGEKREEPRRRVRGGSRAELEEESNIHTQHTRVSPCVARTVAATRRRREDGSLPAPFIFFSLIPLLPAVVTGPQYCRCHCLTLFLPSVSHAALSSFFLCLPVLFVFFFFFLCVCALTCTRGREINVWLLFPMHMPPCCHITSVRQAPSLGSRAYPGWRS